MLTLFKRLHSATQRLTLQTSIAAQTAKRLYGDSTKELHKTPLYEAHVQHGGKIVDFEGWALPVQYKDSITESVLHCRSSASLFDVSHMGQLKFKGPDAIDFLETLLPLDIKKMEVGETKYNFFTNEEGGIEDDTIVTKHQDHLYVVVNAGCFQKDVQHLKKNLAVFTAAGKNVAMEILSENALLALQGPQAATVLQRFVSKDLSQMNFMTGAYTKFRGEVDVLVTRCGYTGEDGFEISIPANAATDVFNTLTKEAEVRPAGLGARDCLRLEGGLCLYGHDLNPSITPVEGSLVWAISERRRKEGGFLGDSVVLSQLKDGVSVKRVGLIVDGPPARDKCEVFSATDVTNKIGEICSGTFSPHLKKPLSMAYIDSQSAKSGTAVKVMIRGKLHDAKVTAMPFLKHKYYKVPKAAPAPSA
eukprot:TRINITY_DN692_c0_g1_i1.p1 TRINITY_DN692_c0_g1~~TRINITY_DN692_c0_g1_i1.p1  ORF type:complete len:418 (+),score=112.16 TRINITY_DN692_c0_g1_i1:57-1310(+)